MSALRSGVSWVGGSAAIIVVIALSLWAHFLVNLPPHQVAVRAQAEQPNFLPSRASVDAFAGGFRQLVAHALYLRTVQYVGSFLRTAEYKLHLYDLYRAVTDLDPAFADVYERGPLLLAYTNRGEDFSPVQKSIFIDQAVQLGKKGVAEFCDADKVARIAAENNLPRLWTDSTYADPCHGQDMIPYQLAYVLFRYTHDAAEASKWYRVAATYPDGVRGARYMAALMQGRAGDRATATMMFLSMAQDQSKPEESCHVASQAAAEVLFPLFQAKSPVPSAFLQRLELARDALLTTQNECSEEFARAVREVTFTVLEAADARYFQAKEHHAADASVLVRAGYIQAPAGDPRSPNNFRFFRNPTTGVWDWGSGPR